MSNRNEAARQKREAAMKEALEYTIKHAEDLAEAADNLDSAASSFVVVIGLNNIAAKCRAALEALRGE